MSENINWNPKEMFTLLLENQRAMMVYIRMVAGEQMRGYPTLDWGYPVEALKNALDDTDAAIRKLKGEE